VVKQVAIVFVALLGVLAGIVALQPAEFAVERSTVIRAPAAAVIAHLENVHAWEAWSPWHRMDPEMKLRYEGPESGPGAAYVWDGPEIGRGRMTVTQVTPERVETQLEFIAPMPGTNRGVFTLEPAGADATRLTWRMEGRNNFIAKAFSLVMSMDQMIGSEFERGLATLKELAESEARGARNAEPPADART
jgi:hypothetical protein